MSATGRNLVGNERRPDDFYATPAWATRAVLPHLRMQPPVLDPCCGEGAILRVCLDYWPCGIELDGERAAKAPGVIRRGDALGGAAWPSHRTIITNPPYSLAMEFIQRALAEAPADADVAFLLRLNFLGSQRRAAFHRMYPSDVYVLPRRPSFTGGGTDATEYCWMVWGANRGGRWSILEVES
jgi:hypothetical protein